MNPPSTTISSEGMTNSLSTLYKPVAILINVPELAELKADTMSLGLVRVPSPAGVPFEVTYQIVHCAIVICEINKTKAKKNSCFFIVLFIDMTKLIIFNEINSGREKLSN
jgi:hypothetical protein